MRRDVLVLLVKWDALRLRAALTLRGPRLASHTGNMGMVQLYHKISLFAYLSLCEDYRHLSSGLEAAYQGLRLWPFMGHLSRKGAG